MKQIIWLIVGTAMSQTHAMTSPIFIQIHSTISHDDLIHINFYGNIFTEFYKCLSDSNSRTCAATLARDNKQPFKFHSRRVIQINKPELISPLESYTDFFQCAYISTDHEQLSCGRVSSDETLYESDAFFQYFRFKNRPSLNSTCIGILWSFQEDILSYDNTVHMIEVCNGIYNSTVRNISTIQPQHVNESWHEIHRHEHGDDNHWKRPHHKEDYLDTKSHIIIAVVVGLGVTAVLIIGAGVFRKRLLQLKDKKNSDAEVGDIASKRNKSKKPSPPKMFDINKYSRQTSVISNPSSEI